MAGVRIQHPTERDCVYTIVDGKRPYIAPHECPTCHLTHTFKTYHFRLDGAGATIVSPEIAEKLKAIKGHPFAIAGEVRKPPEQVVAFAGAPVATPRIVVHDDKKKP